MSPARQREALLPYQYVVLRCVPRVEREEFVNVGVVVHCQRADYLDVSYLVDPDRLRALDPRLDVARVRDTLAYAVAVARAEPRAGTAAEEPLGIRFGLLKAPRSTVVQPGPVHGGLTADPARELDRLHHCLLG